MYKISVVSYLNSKVFLKGLEMSQSTFDYVLDIPSECARKLRENQVDIGLVPVATIPEIPNANIISDYCISADGAVHSVFLFSSTPLDELQVIYLDRHSRSSNKLCQHLTEHYWKINVEWREREIDIPMIQNGEAFVLIGDRTFDVLDNYDFRFDLSEEWKALTGMPFVFAAWVANKKIEPEFTRAFNAALHLGMEYLQDVVRENKLNNFDVHDYLTRKIQYELTENKLDAIQTFLGIQVAHNH